MKIIFRCLRFASELKGIMWCSLDCRVLLQIQYFLLGVLCLILLLHIHFFKTVLCIFWCDVTVEL